MEDRNIITFLENTKIQQYKSDVGFRTLVESVDDNMYVIPKYQRKYRWSHEQVISLVYSLLRGLPIPPIYTCRNKENQLEILDGQQRVMSLFFYYIGYYMKAKKNTSINFCDLNTENLTFKEALMQQYALDELHIAMEDEHGQSICVDYDKLPKAIKRRVDYTTITIIEIKIEQENQREEVLRSIFANLNKGGTLLSDQEQRNGIYNCTFYDILRDFNRNNTLWRKIWGREDRKEKDMETLLRFCALKKYASIKKRGKSEDFIIAGYNSSYTKMLDHFSEESMKFTLAEIDEYIESLEQFVKLFNISNTMSTKVALLESFYIIFEKKHCKIQFTKEICDCVLASKKYRDNTRQGTVNMSKMNQRWRAVYEILSKYAE